ncbi:hypothetical protein ACNAUY_08340 [Acinetobacter tibetensis]|uniref:hypothetical protein n=1 Tax=Acinetobacter tibetensis TaxID=2943497 RepID=UPI003A4DEB9F
MTKVKNMAIAAVLAMCAVGAFATLSSQSAYAKGGGASAGGRGGSVSVSRSFSSSTPSVTRTSVVRTVPTVVKPVAASAVKSKPYYGSRHRDDDVECDTLRNSRYSADREVYRRYCQ